jgi:putative membrane-bound dehydrogenase-like protein
MLRSMSAIQLGLLVFVCAVPASAQQSVDARWVWFNAGDPAMEAPAGEVWFRKEYLADEPSTGIAVVACDDEFVLWVNGQKVGQGNALKAYRFSLSGIVERGTNVFAVEATNKQGRAGLFVDAEIRGQSGRRIPCDSGPEWKATRDKPQGDAWLNPRFDDSQWKPVKVIGAHAESPWKDISFEAGDLDRFQVAAGFELRRVADHKQVGSLVAMTWGNRGRLLVSRERGPILNVIDTDGDGVCDEVTEFSAQVKNCQGLCMVFDDLYAVGDGPQGTGVYRLPDRDRDDKADEIIHLVKHKGGMGEHGPHDIIFGPDGWLYHNMGNHAWIQNTPEPTTPCRNYVEGYLLEPRFEDAGGHAAGIKAPGGTIWRFTPDGKKWWMETNGFRNEYDMAFNAAGDLFAFDSDMEWDVNLPWYRPVRINHCVPGAEFGWRSGAAKWPDYYFDSLPAAIDVGRGSPTGVVFYEHTQFPEKYRGAMLNCDWSMGRIIAAYLSRDGATYTGTFDNLVTGNPLNVSDIEVDRDGSVVFCTGGRNTEGGIYRVTWVGEGSSPAGKVAGETLNDALNMPQTQSAWAREACENIKVKLGDGWGTGLADQVRTGSARHKVRALTLLSQHGPKPEPSLLIAAARDADASVRQFAALLLGEHSAPEVAATLADLLRDKDPVVQRRACEAFVRSGQEAPADRLLKLLENSDRWVRYAARIALERVPTDRWKGAVLQSENLDVATSGLLALLRLGSPEPPTREIGDKLVRLFALPRRTAEQQLNLLRLLQLAILADNDGSVISSEQQANIGRTIAESYATGDDRRDVSTRVYREAARLMARLQAPNAAAILVKALHETPSADAKMHLALCLRYVNDGWTFDLKRQYLDWYESTPPLEGGNSLHGYLRNIVAGGLDRFTPEERRHFILQWNERPLSARLLISSSEPAQIKDFEQTIAQLMAEFESSTAGNSQEFLSLTVDALSKSAAPESQALLRKLADSNADRRDLLGRALAKHPTAENIPYLLRAVASGDSTTQQICLEALGKSKFTPSKPEEFRTVILAGLKLGTQGGIAAANLLKAWTGADHQQGKDAVAAIGFYQAWFREKYPEEPAPELATADVEKTKYTVQQLVDFLENSGNASSGDVARGKQIFTKANCVKCHKFGNEGEGVGPDLTTVRRRFQKKEIIESILIPSQVMSDQYAAVTVLTKEGLVHTGMPLPNPGSRNLLLLLPDATRLEIPAAKIEEKTKAKTSVMPEGLLKELSLQDIADLFAFLETSKNNPEPAATAGAPTSKSP